MLNVASAWLSRNIDALNALNVFPVPDGDTGTNMALTMQAAMNAVASSPSHSCAEIAAGVSHGALMGARGNSGRYSPRFGGASLMASGAKSASRHATSAMG